MAEPTVFEQIVDYANRADPWPLYRELRKTPVAREPDGSYVVTRYRDIIALAGLARRLDNPRLVADPPPYRPSVVLHGPRHLQVEFDRVGVA